jgi:hypothetical protein
METDPLCACSLQVTVCMVLQMCCDESGIGYLHRPPVHLESGILVIVPLFFTEHVQQWSFDIVSVATRVSKLMQFSAKTYIFWRYVVLFDSNSL